MGAIYSGNNTEYFCDGGECLCRSILEGTDIEYFCVLCEGLGKAI